MINLEHMKKAAEDFDEHLRSPYWDYSEMLLSAVEEIEMLRKERKDAWPLSRMLDSEMPAQTMRLHMGEMTAQEVRTARAAIGWANRFARSNNT